MSEKTLIDTEKLSELDNRICEKERAVLQSLTDLKASELNSSQKESVKTLATDLSELKECIRSLRAEIYYLESNSGTETQLIPEEVKETVANEITKGTHDKPATFTDFVKGMLMWQETPEERLNKTL